MQRAKHVPSITTLSRRHEISGLNSVFSGGQAIFSDYIQATRAMLSSAHTMLDSEQSEQRAEGNAPFERMPATGFQAGRNKPFRRGILLTHGLSDSPYSMRHLADFFAQNGFRVMVVLLPGHGTQPGDLLDVTWQEWEKTVAYAADKLAEQVDEVYLGGSSTGATLSVCHSLHDARVRGLFLFAPAFKISPLAALVRWHKLFSWLWPRGKWLSVLPDLDCYKYESFTSNAAAQIYALTQHLARQLAFGYPDIPIFTAASADDMTVDSAATIRFMQAASHAQNKLVLYGDGSVSHQAGRVEQLPCVFPEHKILSSAHTAIVIAPEDAHYGAAGAYCNCVHYYQKNPAQYHACMAHPQRAWQGEITKKNLRVGTLRRLTYNPHFAALKISMQRFIDGLP